MLIVGIECEDAAGQRVHHVLAGSLHDDVPHKVDGERPVACQQFLELGKLFFGGKFSEQKEVDDLLKREVVVFREALDERFHIVSAVAEDAVDLCVDAVDDLVAPDFGDLRKAGQDTFTVAVAQSALDVVLGIESRIDLTVFDRALRKFLYLRGDRRKISCEIHWQPLLSV